MELQPKARRPGKNFLSLQSICLYTSSCTFIKMECYRLLISNSFPCLIPTNVQDLWAAGKISCDRQSRPFDTLSSRWLGRSEFPNREERLFGLSADIDMHKLVPLVCEVVHYSLECSSRLYPVYSVYSTFRTQGWLEHSGGGWTISICCLHC